MIHVAATEYRTVVQRAPGQLRNHYHIRPASWQRLRRLAAKAGGRRVGRDYVYFSWPEKARREHA